MKKKNREYDIVGRTITFGVFWQCRERLSKEKDAYEYPESGGDTSIYLGVANGEEREQADHFKVLYDSYREDFLLLDEVPKGHYHSDSLSNDLDENTREYVIDFYGKPSEGRSYIYRQYRIVKTFGNREKNHEEMYHVEKKIDMLMPIKSENKQSQILVKFPKNQENKICLLELEEVLKEGKHNFLYHVSGVYEIDQNTQSFSCFEAPADEVKPMICISPYNPCVDEAYLFSLELFYKGEEGKVFDYPKSYLDDLVWFKDFRKQVVGSDFIDETAVMKNNMVKETASLERADAYQRKDMEWKKTGSVGFSGFRLKNLTEGSIGVYFEDHFYENVPLKEIIFHAESGEYTFVDAPHISEEGGSYLLTLPNGKKGVVTLDYGDYMICMVEEQREEANPWNEEAVMTYIESAPEEYYWFLKYYQL